jgi:hypothetical protein
MHLCLDAYSMVQSCCIWYDALKCDDAMLSTFSELIKNVLYRKTTSEGLAQSDISRRF